MSLDKPRITAVRSFLRSFSILLKSARLYGLGHDRCKALCGTAWTEFQSAMLATGSLGFVLGFSGTRLLLDGEPMDVSPAERAIADFFSSSGFDSVQFCVGVTEEELIAFVRSCAATGTKGNEAAEQLRAAFTGTKSSIRVNEIRFVASGPGGFSLPSMGEAGAPTPAAAPAQPAAPPEPALPDDPEKLLKLILATPAGDKAGEGAAGDVAESTDEPVEEQQAISLVQVLVQFAGGLRSGQPAAAAGQLRGQLGGMPISVRQTLQQALASLAEVPPGPDVNRPLLLRLVEQLAIRFALERVSRGEGEVVGGQKLLDRMREEVESLRKILAFQEEKMKQAGLPVESAADALDRQFWAGVPESGKRTVLVSAEAWCIPPRNVRQYVEQLLERGEGRLAELILKNYAECVQSPEPRARRKAAAGIGELADLYGKVSPPFLIGAIGSVTAQMAKESDAPVSGLLRFSFIKLAQEAAAKRNYAAVTEALALLPRLEQARPGTFGNLRADIGIESKLQEFVDGSLRLPTLPPGLGSVLLSSPQATLEILSGRLAKCVRRRERDRVVELLQELGAAATPQLNEIVRSAPPAKAAFAAGLLSRLDAGGLESTLRKRLPEWHRSYHDVVVQQVAAGGATGRGELLAKLIDVLDPLVLGETLEEIGLSGEEGASPRLLALAKGEILPSASPYVRLKAVEALGRLRDLSSVAFLTDVVLAKRLGRPVHHRELRIAAAQSLAKVDAALAQGIQHDSGFTENDLRMAPLDPSENWPALRTRRYPRVRLTKVVGGSVTTPRAEYEVQFRALSLGGGLFTCEQPVSVGTEAAVKMKLGLRTLNAKVLLRTALTQGISFSMAEMDLDERARLRSLLTD